MCSVDYQNARNALPLEDLSRSFTNVAYQCWGDLCSGGIITTPLFGKVMFSRTRSLLNSVNWSKLRPGVPAISESSYKGQKCVKFAVREYKNLPWCVNPLQVAPVIDILSRDGNFVSFFKLPRPVVVSNETTFFVNLVDCLQFLKSKHLALESIGLEVFCQGDEEQSCKLSPYCQPVSDPSGSLLVNNMREIASLRLFQRERILDSLRTAKSIHDLKGHPATWSSLEDVSFLFHYSAFASPNNSNFKLDHLIMTRNENGQVDWANEPLINNDIKGRTYKRNCFQNLLRYARNKMAHFGECDEKLGELFDSSPSWSH